MYPCTGHGSSVVRWTREPGHRALFESVVGAAARAVYKETARKLVSRTKPNRVWKVYHCSGVLSHPAIDRAGTLCRPPVKTVFTNAHGYTGYSLVNRSQKSIYFACPLR